MSGTSTEDDNDEIVTHYTDYTLIVDDQTDDDVSAGNENECYPNKKGDNTRRLLLHQKTCDPKNQESNVAALNLSCISSLYTVMCRPVANIVHASVDGISNWINDQQKRVKKRRMYNKICFDETEDELLDDYLMRNTYGLLQVTFIRERVPEDIRNQLIKEACELFEEMYYSNYRNVMMNYDGSDEKLEELYHAHVYWLKRIRTVVKKAHAVAGYHWYTKDRWFIAHILKMSWYSFRQVEEILKEAEENLAAWEKDRASNSQSKEAS